MEYEGLVYRPPSEARSLIVQVTVGCSHNTCTFCTMYKNKSFKIRNIKDILSDFESASKQYGPYVRRVFLADGDALVVSTEMLLEILHYAKRAFPNLERVTSYGTSQDILRKTPEELALLKNAGLDMVYMGLESGDPQVLRDIHKDATREMLSEAGRKLQDNGIQCSATLISGLGGKRRLEEHAVASATLVSEIKPAFLGFLTLMLDECAPIYSRIVSGDLVLLEPDDIVREMRLFLSNVDSEGTVFRSNHASNYIVVNGTLNKDIASMQNYLNQVEKDGLYRPEEFRRL